MEGNTMSAPLKYYYEKIRNNPEEKAKRAEYHAKWQRDNREKHNEYVREYRRRKRGEEQNEIQEAEQ